MKTVNLMIIAIMMSLVSCKMLEIKLDPSLQTNTKVMPVKGKQSFKFKKTLTFGDYVVTESKNSWPWIRTTNFFIKKVKGKQKMQFDIANAQQDTFSFFGLSELKVISHRGLRRAHPWLPEIDLMVEDIFEGSIQTPQGIWELVVYNANSPDRKKSTGFLYNNGKIYHLEGIRHLDHSPSLPTDRHGYAFKDKGKTIATVRTFSSGKVWMKEDLDEDTQLLLATVSAALLLQHPMRKS